MGVGNIHGSAGLIDQLGADAYIGFDGESGASAGPAFSTVSAPFEGLFEYCQQARGSPSPVATGEYTCIPDRPGAHVRCMSKKHTFILTRQ